MEINGIAIDIVENSKGNLLVSQIHKGIALHYPCQTEDDCTPYKVTLPRGCYFFQLFGAAGGSRSGDALRGKGGYSAGVYKVKQDYQELYVYIGGVGSNESIGGYNGGGSSYGSASGGGGATDIRTSEGTWDNHQSLNSRIIVAGGGGGSRNDLKGGNGGGLYGEQGKYQSSNKPCYGGPETCIDGSGDCTNQGSKGAGASADEKWDTWNGGGGGGGGYIGGGAAGNSAGSGGSGFIEGLYEPKVTMFSNNSGNGLAMITIYHRYITIEHNIQCSNHIYLLMMFIFNK